MVKNELFKLVEKHARREVTTLEMSWGDVIKLLEEIEDLLEIEIFFTDIEPRTPKGLLRLING
jgi:hypothetical protein